VLPSTVMSAAEPGGRTQLASEGEATPRMSAESSARPGEGSVLDVAQLEARLGILTAFVGGILFEIDAEGRYVGIWTGEPDLLAAPIASLLGRRVIEVIGADLGESFVAMFRRVLETGAHELFSYTLDVPAGRRNFTCEVRRTPVTPGREPPKTLTLLVRDVTDETVLKAKLVEAERLAAMGLVAASVGHEIRQPLAFATTSLEVLARELASAPANARATEALGHVRDAIRRIAGIATSIDVVTPHPQRQKTTDVRRPVLAAIDLCASELQDRGRVVVDVPELPPVHLGEGELCQVVVNLLLNAVHAIVPGREGRIDLVASFDRAEASVRISVADRGSGIDPAHVGQIFDAFFTTKGPGRGTGLGLFVSRRIVEQVGGRLTIESRLGAGTIVHVTLPVAPESAVAPTPIRDPKRRLDILVIDDEPAFLRSLELLLEDAHSVVICARSPDALALVRGQPKRFDAVLCDLSMPEIDGVAFHDEMETLGVGDRFILMTAGAFTPHGEDFLRQAKCRQIGKPFTLDKLLAVLATVGEG
jgi:two-component system, NtrC family, sensor kinase